ncbi:MAG: ABC transporter ATP-binding protein, partial [Lachnospiraceae bacterium]|nr:ABC transporter ATP-binding protein [Lachnospiraceae bacterium]
KLLQKTSREKNMTVIVITHNLAIAPMADRILKVRNGKVVSEEKNANPLPVEKIEW